MRNRWPYFRPVLDYLGLLLFASGLVLVVPLALRMIFAGAGRAEVPAAAYWVPAVAAMAGGLALKRNLRFPALDNRCAMILCASGWIVVSAVAGVPFALGLGLGWLDAYFEGVSGLTTTGITVLRDLDHMALSILFWRSLLQWLGGLGILTLFLAILYTGGSAHRLFGAESHKVFSRRPAPGLFHTLRILWLIYLLFTAVITGALVAEGLGLFDAVTHGMTAVCTGGYTPHDAGIDHFRQQGYRTYVLIEYTLIVGMLLGGISFFVHYRLLRGGLRALWDTLEMRLWWGVLVVATAVVMADHFRRFGLQAGGLHETFRTSLFQVVSMVTTTGFLTRDIASDYFPPAAKQVFLALMVLGGCVGSTSGGLKVLRAGVLGKMARRQVARMIHGPAMVHPLAVDGDMVETEELRRIAAMFFAWMALLAAGGIVTALLSDYDALASASGMFSALGNIGPSYIPMGETGALHPVIKIVYILGMLAGRLEIIPLLLLFSPRTWR